MLLAWLCVSGEAEGTHVLAVPPTHIDTRHSRGWFCAHGCRTYQGPWCAHGLSVDVVDDARIEAGRLQCPVTSGGTFSCSHGFESAVDPVSAPNLVHGRAVLLVGGIGSLIPLPSANPGAPFVCRRHLGVCLRVSAVLVGG